MIKISVLIVAGSLLSVSAIAGEPTVVEPPRVPSMESQKEYFKALAIYQSISAEISDSQRKLALDQPLLEEQRKKVSAAASAAVASCGEGYTFDQQKLASAELVCVPKPPAPDAAKPAEKEPAK